MREREVKAVVDATAAPPDLHDLVPGSSIGRTESRPIADVYHDTDDLRLARWGATLRFRRGTGWTLKLPDVHTDAALAREEIVLAGPAIAPPAEALAIVSSLTRGRPTPTAVVARFDTERQVRHWIRGDGAPIAELTDDRVVATTVDGATHRFREFEVEFAEDIDDALIAQVARRMATVAAPGPAMPKLVRVLGARAQAPPDVVVVEVGRHPRGRDLVVDAVSRSSRRLLLALPFARLGEDPEGVHVARVATRRLRSDLRTFAPLLEPAQVDHLRGELASLADALGAVRDADVLGAVLRAGFGELADADPAAIGRVLEAIEHRQGAARRALGEMLDHPSTDGLLEELVAASTGLPCRKRAGRPASRVLPRLLDEVCDRLAREVARLPDVPGAPDLHRIRIRTKRVRYAAEAVAPVLGKPARRVARAAATLQDELGMRNDLAIAVSWLTTSADLVDGPAAFTAGRLAERFTARLAATPDEWRDRYEDLARRVSECRSSG